MKMKKIIGITLVTILMASFFVGCQLNKEANSQESILITDAFGDQIILNQPATRIISTYSAITENIYALGAGDALIGGGSTEHYPKEATELPSFSYSKDDVEKFIGAKPDVVFFRKVTAAKYSDLISNLNSAGIITIALDNEGFEEYITTIAKVVGKEETAKNMLKEFNDEMKALADRASKIPDEARVSAFFESMEKDYKTPSDQSIIYHGLKMIGVYNVADKDMERNATSTIAEFGDEYLFAQAENIDVYIAQNGRMNQEATVENIRARPGFDVIKAIKEDKILIVDEKVISSPTFRQIIGLQAIYDYVYPQY